jgi:Fe-Mn family superoxide dismutase
MNTWISAILHATYPFSLPALEYSYASLEPHIDTATMTIHHQKHHQAYINNLNTGLEKHPEFQTKTLEWLVANWQTLPENLKNVVRNHGGGHLNHAFFWQILSSNIQKPSENLEKKLVESFESLENFKAMFNKAALSVFGSGWAWLCVDSSGKLVIFATANQDNPLTHGLSPLLGLDVWEHAYYLKYQNMRAAYIDAFWNIIAWNRVEELLKM